MKKLLSSLFLLVAVVVATHAQKPAPIKVKSGGLGRVIVTSGKLRSSIDLSKNVSGCLYASAAIKKQVKDCAASPVSFALVDATEKDGFNYVLISTDAAGNCNVCGRCGASTAFGLVWLKLDSSLKLVDKQSTPIEFCLLEVTLLSDIVEFNEQTQIEKLNLVFDAKDVLTVEFEKQITVEKEDEPRYEFSHLEYSRKAPEKGLVIKTEKRMKSATDK